MEYNFREIEAKWISFWKSNKSYKVSEDSSKQKYYVLDMFPYPSGAGLHVGHPLGYIASDVLARYKKLEGYNVLHPMGYDSFGLPAEQYAIQTGQHPAITTDKNIERYRNQLDQLGFCYDWDRELRTSSPDYYKWTQWIFKQLFDCYYDERLNKAVRISALVSEFEISGNQNVQATNDCESVFSSKDWMSFDAAKKEATLQQYRLAYLADSWVNWCPELGTVLANDEIVNGKSERGGHPVMQKKMRQWSMRIKAYAERLLKDLDHLDWTDSIKEQQRNWIGKSVGCSVLFEVESHTESIEVFTTRPDTIFGVSFMVLAPEHPLVKEITTNENRTAVLDYQRAASKKTERDRQSDVKTISGQNTGAFVIHPLSGEKIQIWIADYVLASYGTGAVMAVPCGDQRDFDFAKYFDIEIKNIFDNIDVSEAAHIEKWGTLKDSSFLNGLEVVAAIKKVIQILEAKSLGKGTTNYRLRDAVFSRQRYWGEPFPIFYQENIPKTVSDENLPIELPKVDSYLPTQQGEPPLARADKSSWNYFAGDRMEYNTMPGWAGSSWYFLRYMDPSNEVEFVSKEKSDYWNQVDLYIGGAEHATGHLLYSRFWTKFLFDQGYISFDEPFKKLINQGMILGKSSFVYRLLDRNTFVSKGKIQGKETQPIHVDISLVENNKLDLDGFKKWRPDYSDASFVLEDNGDYVCGEEVEKMSKSKFNVETPDDLIQKYGADTLRLYEMFLGPIEQSKPWDTKGISGVHNFLRKCWRLYCNADGSSILKENEPTKDELKTLHKTIKRIREDLDRYSLNTCVSTFMIAVNAFTDYKCNNKVVLESFLILLAPYAPHFCEELWMKSGQKEGSLFEASYPNYDEKHLVEDSFDYPISFNGKMRFKVNLSLSLNREEILKEVEGLELTKKWLDGKNPKKIIVVPGKIVNIVL
ncbi:MAG: leucine--tRNA ligase [Crocinitomicaceae bacterium]|jgi:leucyl-tRNA synthetase|tara:strand:+ start:3175 stop:5949 length:2775 start_codon:yes stop_codon:yes gene_type:complete